MTNDIERKLLKDIGDALHNIVAQLSDEGDRVYLASTNHADTLKELVSKYDNWFWEQPEANIDPLVDDLD